MSYTKKTGPEDRQRVSDSVAFDAAIAERLADPNWPEMMADRVRTANTTAGRQNLRWHLAAAILGLLLVPPAMQYMPGIMPQNSARVQVKSIRMTVGTPGTAPRASRQHRLLSVRCCQSADLP